MPNSILLIDDEQLVTKTLKKLLKANGYNAVVTSSAKEALEKVKDTDFGLIVCDIRMPETNGIEAVENIREYLKQNNKPSIPEILITGYADEDAYKSAIDLEVAEYLYKPFDTGVFLEAVKRHLK